MLRGKRAVDGGAAQKEISEMEGRSRKKLFLFRRKKKRKDVDDGGAGQKKILTWTEGQKKALPFFFSLALGTSVLNEFSFA